MTYVTVAWMFGAVWLASTSGAPLTLFAEKLGASEFQFGLLAALPFLASLLSLPASVYTERSGQRKRVFFLGLYGQRLLWLPIAVMPVWIAWTWGITSGWAAAVFLWLVFFMHAGQAVGGPAGVGWVAGVVPGRSRGTYFSRRRQWGILTAIPASLFVGWLLDQHRDGTDLAVLGWCSLIFICAMLFGVVDIVLFHFVPHVPRPKPAVPLRKMLVRPLHDRQFLRFGAFVGVLVFAVSFMGQFVTLYLIQKLHVSNTGIQLMLIAAPMLAQLLVLPMWGRVVDRMGKKPALAIASLGLVPVGLGWCFMNSGAVWLGYLLSVAGGALWVGVEVANLDLIMEFSEARGGDDAGGGAALVAGNTGIINIAGRLGGLISGLVATWLRDFSWNPGIAGLAPFTYFEVLFFISAMLRFIAVVAFLPFVHEPDAKPTVVALRFMTSNFYNNLHSFVSQPIKLLRRRKDESDQHGEI